MDTWEARGLALREFREAAGVLQREAADRIPINRGTLSLIETGKLRMPEGFEEQFRSAVQEIAAERAQAVGVPVGAA